MKPVIKQLCNIKQELADRGIVVQEPIQPKPETDIFDVISANIEPDAEPISETTIDDIDFSVFDNAPKPYVEIDVASGAYEGLVAIRIDGRKIELVTPSLSDCTHVDGDADMAMKMLLGSMRLTKRGSMMKMDFTRTVQGIAWNYKPGDDASAIVASLCKMATHLGLEFNISIAGYVNFVPNNMVLTPEIKHKEGRMYIQLVPRSIGNNMSLKATHEAMRLLRHNIGSASIEYCQSVREERIKRDNARRDALRVARATKAMTTSQRM